MYWAYVSWVTLSVLYSLFDVKIPDNMRAYLCSLFALSVVVSPLQRVVSAVLMFYLVWFTVRVLSISNLFSLSLRHQCNSTSLAFLMTEITRLLALYLFFVFMLRNLCFSKPGKKIIVLKTELCVQKEYWYSVCYFNRQELQVTGHMHQTTALNKAQEKILCTGFVPIWAFPDFGIEVAICCHIESVWIYNINVKEYKINASGKKISLNFSWQCNFLARSQFVERSSMNPRISSVRLLVPSSWRHDEVSLNETLNPDPLVP